jgi:hypothetical protein
VGLLGVLFLVGGCGSGGNPDGGGSVGNGNAIGRPCDLLADADVAQVTYNPAAAECPSNLCLKPAQQSSRAVSTGATCSAECTTDSDCNGETRDPKSPTDTRCMAGFACGVPLVVGPLCCKKLCMCKDFLDPGLLSTPLTCDPAQNQGLGCQEAPGPVSAGEPLPSPQQETDFSILVSPEREVDILFMVDNSPSMDPKQARLASNFGKMVNVLQQIPDGSGYKSLPDVHIGVISSDMGAGSEGIGQNCRRVLGDRGLLYGNDPNNPIASVAPNADPNQGGHPQPNGCGLHSGQRWISDIANPNGTGRIMNYDGNIQDVFSCLATAVGTSGCGFEHQLQSTRVALNADYPDSPTATPNMINPENIGFVRPNAYLAIVLLTDEDDCSAAPDDTVNDGMFLETQQVPTETASLRCAARGHVCNGQPIPGYDNPSIGYQPPNPLPAPNVGFTTAFANCDAKDQPNPATGKTDSHYLPLIIVQDMINSVNGITAWAVDANGNYVYASGNHVSVQKRPDQILVSGIIGWPPDAALAGVTISDQYQIGIDTTSLPVPQNTYWDYMPICTVPTITSADGNIYRAYGGLRLKKFLDAFQKTDLNGNPVQNTFSLCNADFTTAMSAIANAIAQVLKPGCVQYPLIDTQPNPISGGPIQPECQVTDKIPCDSPGTNGCLASSYIENPLPECRDPTSGLPFDPTTTSPTSAQLDVVPDSARPCWYLYYDPDPVSGCPDAYNHQRITALRPSGTQAPAGTVLAMKCLTCARADQACSPLYQ